MATTTNYGWTTPDDTALVKDGAAAIRTLGTSVDTTTKNLNPSTTLGDIEYRSSTANTNTRLPIGTSGQFLSVVAGVPAWAAVSPLSAKGDLYTRNATVDARLPIGTNGFVLTADSAEATGIKWAATAASGGPAFRAFRATSDQSISNSTWTKVELNSETFDTASAFDSTTNYRFTPQTAGYYQINGQIKGYQSNYDRRIELAIYKNGSEIGLGSSNTGSNEDAIPTISDLIYFNGSSDYVELYAWIQGTSAVVRFGTSITFFGGVWIRS
jgi:hypothetical protein